MNIKTHFTEALNQLLAAKLRAFLAVLGILVGTASVVAMISIGQLSQQQILSQFKSLGINLLSVSIYPESYNSGSSANPNANLSIKEAKNLTTASKNIIIAAPYVSVYGNLIYRGKSMQGSTDGVTPAMFKLAKLKLKMGRKLSFLDASNYFCVIGNTIYNNIKKQGYSNPIGSQIKIGASLFTIVGVLKKWPMNFFFNTDFNTSVLVPIATSLSLNKRAVISSIALRLRNADNFKTTEKAVKTYITAHTIKQDIMVRSPKTIINSFEKASETMTILLGLIGSISLLVGGIGIMNIMLVSVAERHKEIGIRLAIGAKQRDIQLQFMIEAVVLSLFGGIFGMLLGILVAFIVAVVKDWSFTIFFIPPIVGCLVTILTGIFFGFYPAWKASKLDPVQTLRSD